MTLPEQKMTSAQFWVWLCQSEYDPKQTDRLGGYAVKIAFASAYISVLGAKLGTHLLNHVMASGDAGFVTGASGGYDITPDDTFAPHVAYVDKQHLSPLTEDGFFPMPPDFAVEIIGKDDWDNPLRHKQARFAAYQQAKIKLLWYVYPERQEVDVYVNGVKVRTAGVNDTLDGGAVLPGFTLSVAKIFA